MEHRILRLILSVFLIYGMIGITGAQPVDKVIICHKTGVTTQPEETKEISQEEWLQSGQIHLKHGDTMGGCEKSRIPELPIVALPLASIIGLVFFFQQRRKE